MKNYEQGAKSFLETEKLVNDFEMQSTTPHPSSTAIKNIMSQLRDMANKDN